MPPCVLQRGARYNSGSSRCSPWRHSSGIVIQLLSHGFAGSVSAAGLGVRLVHGFGGLAGLHALDGELPGRRFGLAGQHPGGLTAAPMATYSSVAGRVTSMPRIEGASVRMATDFAPPPMSRMRLISAPSERISSRQSRWEHSRPSTNARARFSLVVLCRVRPVSEAVASGRFGVRSPSKYGTRVMPPAPARP